MRPVHLSLGIALALALSGLPAASQWIHHHPTVKGYRAHHYFEGYELPIVASGAMDPQPTPDGKAVILASRGWIWRLDLATGVSTRLTHTSACDSRPALSRDGRQLAFVRDDNTAMWIVLKDLATGQERELAKSGRLDLDPVFTRNDQAVLYASTEGGDVDLWSVDLGTGAKNRLTQEAGLEMRPLPLPDGKRVLYLHKTRPGTDQLRMLDLERGTTTVLLTGPILSQTRPSLSPDGRLVALNLPNPGVDTYHLALLDLQFPHFHQVVDRTCTLPLTPGWSHDSAWIYYVEDEGSHTFSLKRVPTLGGPAERITLKAWNYGVPTARLQVATRKDASSEPLPARLEVTDGGGHPLFPDETQLHFDPQSGRTYFFSPGTTTFTVPVGEVRALATHGFGAVPQGGTLNLGPDQHATLDLSLKSLWNPRTKGWYGGDTHFHINYGGPYVLKPEDLYPLMAAEDLDAAMPMAANLHTRYTDPAYLNWKKADKPPLVHLTQEVRNHFLGHLGLIQMGAPFAPWFYGPGYPVTSHLDLPNAEVLAHGRQTGAFVTYMHPFGVPDPFNPEAIASIPNSLVADLVMGRADGLEMSCLWVNELGVSSLWYRLLNLGIPVVPTGGSDAFMNFYRCSTPGSNRVYVKVEGPCTLEAYYAALRKSRVVVTSGPLLDFQVGGQEPGGVLPQTKKAAWTLAVHSPVPVAKVEILVNGAVVATHPGPDQAGSRTYSGQIPLPEGGWVAARVHGETSVWPVMNSRTFAHTGPIWIDKAGSTQPQTRRRAAQDLLPLVVEAKRRLESTYAPAQVPKIKATYDEALARLEGLSR